MPVLIGVCFYLVKFRTLNMDKFCAAVCLLAFISMTIATPVIPWIYGTCEDNEHTYMNEFDSERFFRGTWYEIFSHGVYLFEDYGICPAFQSKITDDSVKFLFYQYVYQERKWENLTGTADFSEMEGSQFVMLFHDLADLAVAVVPFSVIDTDYKNYAVLYSCQEAFGMKLEMVLAYSRKRNDKSKFLKVKRAIEAAKLDSYIFTESYCCTDYCEEDEPKL